MAIIAALLLGEEAKYTAVCARGMRASGIPITFTAWKQLLASNRAFGFALPMSSEAKMTILRAMNRGSSPAISIRAIQ